MLYYKYKSLEPFEHIADILNNERFYCAKVNELNDPLEGLFQANIVDLGIQTLYAQNDKTRVCSFSETIEEILLWVHYANSFKGIVFEFEPNKILERVRYKNSLFVFNGEENPKKIVYSTKIDIWKYEKEYRYIPENNNEKYLYGKLKSVTLGMKVDSEIRKIVGNICNYKHISIYKAKINYKTTKVEREEI